MTNCPIYQPAGLGDVLLSLKIATHFLEEGYEVIFPVCAAYKNLNEKIKKSAGIKFYNIEEEFPLKDTYNLLVSKDISDIHTIDNVLFVPLKRSFHSSFGKNMQRNNSHDASNMLAKFGMCGLTSHNWQNYFEIKRDRYRERELLNYLGLSNARYHLVNKHFGTPPQWDETLKRTIFTPPDLQKIEMEYIEGFDVFDWMGVFEGASKIDSVSTSTFYIFEKIDLGCMPTIYSRNTSHRTYEENFGWLKILANKKYTFIG